MPFVGIKKAGTKKNPKNRSQNPTTNQKKTKRNEETVHQRQTGSRQAGGAGAEGSPNGAWEAAVGAD